MSALNQENQDKLLALGFAPNATGNLRYKVTAADDSNANAIRERDEMIARAKAVGIELDAQYVEEEGGFILWQLGSVPVAA